MCVVSDCHNLWTPKRASMVARYVEEVLSAVNAKGNFCVRWERCLLFIYKKFCTKKDVDHKVVHYAEPEAYVEIFELEKEEYFSCNVMGCFVAVFSAGAALCLILETHSWRRAALLIKFKPATVSRRQGRVIRCPVTPKVARTS